MDPINQAQSSLSVLPAAIGLKFISGAFRGLAPVLVITAAGMATAAVYGAVKSGQAINKYIQKPKPGDNKGSKLLKEVEKKQLLGKDKKPIPIGDMMSFHKIDRDLYEKFEKYAKKHGMPYSKVDYGEGGRHFEIMIVKDHDKVMEVIKQNVGQDCVTEFNENKSKKELEAKQEGKPAVYEPEPDANEVVAERFPSILPERSVHKNILEKIAEIAHDFCKKLGLDISQKPPKELQGQGAENIMAELENAFAEEKVQAIAQDAQDIAVPNATEHDLTRGNANTNNGPAIQYRMHSLQPSEMEEIKNMVEEISIAHNISIKNTSKGILPERLAAERNSRTEETLKALKVLGFDHIRVDSKTGNVELMPGVQDKNKLMDSVRKVNDEMKNPNFLTTLHTMRKPENINRVIENVVRLQTIRDKNEPEKSLGKGKQTSDKTEPPIKLA